LRGSAIFQVGGKKHWGGTGEVVIFRLCHSRKMFVVAYPRSAWSVRLR